MKLKNIIDSLTAKFAALALAFTCVGSVWADLPGSGTEADPYTISSLAQLKEFRDSVNASATSVYKGKYVRLDVNVDLNNEQWTPIGNTMNTPLNCIFDGNGNTISNLYINDSSMNIAGFIGATSYATVKNLKVHNANLTGNDYVGAIAGRAYAVTTVQNCEVSGSIRLSGNHYVGGITGSGYATVTGCKTIGDGVATSYIHGADAVANSGDGDDVGGIIGLDEGGTSPISDCYVSDVTIEGFRQVGGIAGLIQNGRPVDSCSVKDVVVKCIADQYTVENKAARMAFGGIVGAISQSGGGSVTGCTVENVQLVSDPVGVSAARMGYISGGYYNGADGFLIPDRLSSKITGADNTVKNVVRATEGLQAPAVPSDVIDGPVVLIIETGDLTPSKEITAETTEVNYTVPVTVKDSTGNVISETAAQEIAVSVGNEDVAGITLTSVKINDVVTKAVESVGEDATSVTAIEIQVKSTPGEAAQSVTYEVHPEAVVTVSKTGEAATSSTVELSNSDLAANATFTFDLDVSSLNLSAGDQVKVTHSWDAYTNASGTSVAAGNETTLSTVAANKVTITTTHFSTWTLEGITIEPSTVAVVFAANGASTQYTSLAAAVEAVPTDGTETTITMLADETIAADAGITIVAGKNIVLDLNGQTVQMAVASADERWLIKNEGTLTVKDSAENGKLLMSATGQASTAVHKSTIKNMGALTVESGMIELTYSGAAKEEPTAIMNDAADRATSLIFKGGTVVNSSNRGMGVYLAINDTNATVFDVQGGRVEGYGSAVRYYFDDRNLTDAKLTFNMSNGTIYGRGMYGLFGMTTSSKDWNSISFNISGGTISCAGLLGRKHISPLQGTVSISGGTFDGDVYIYGHALEITDGDFAGNVTLHRTKESLESASISGGQFSSGLTIAETTNENTTNPYYNAKFITGGIYGTAPEARNVVDGYMSVANTDQATSAEYPYTVGIPQVAQIGDVTYATFADAITAAEEYKTANGDYPTITVLNENAEQTNLKWKIDSGYLVRSYFYQDAEDSDLWHVENLVGLKEFRDSVNGGEKYTGKTVQLDADVDLSLDVDANNQQVSWIPIGLNTPNSTPKKNTSSIRFDGTFNGNGHTISNLYINNSSLIGAGLFGVAQDGEIKNITFYNVEITAESYIGSAVGFTYSNVNNCDVTGIIDIDGRWMVGGVVGQSYAYITDCNVNGTSKTSSHVIATHLANDLEGDKVGGIVGHFNDGFAGAMSNCSVSKLAIAGSRDVGGMVGYFSTCNTLTGCSVSDLTITANAPLDYAQSKSSKIHFGGVIGSLSGEDVRGKIQVTVQDIDLRVEVEGVKEIAKMGYVSGGLYGKDPMSGPSTLTDLGIVVSGTNSSQGIQSCDNVFVQAPGMAVVAHIVRNGEIVGKYETLAEALAVAQKEDTITLLANVSETAVLPYAVMLDKNGFTCGELTAATGYAVVNFSGNTDLYRTFMDNWERPDYADLSWFTANTDASAFEISTAAQLAGFAQLVNGKAFNADGTRCAAPARDSLYTFYKKTITLTADVDLSTHGWVPIGTDPYSEDSSNKSYTGNMFSGTFDGGNHTIAIALNEQNSIYDFDALFGSLTRATIKNLALDATISYPGTATTGTWNADVYGGACALASYAAQSVVSNVTMNGTALLGTRATAGGGGLVSFAYYGTSFFDCTNNATVSIRQYYRASTSSCLVIWGGIANQATGVENGPVPNVRFVRCVNNASVKMENPYNNSRVLGKADNGDGSMNKLKNELGATTFYSRRLCAGGMVGWLANPTANYLVHIVDCEDNGTVVGCHREKFGSDGKFSALSAKGSFYGKTYANGVSTTKSYSISTTDKNNFVFYPYDNVYWFVDVDTVDLSACTAKGEGSYYRPQMTKSATIVQKVNGAEVEVTDAETIALLNLSARLAGSIAKESGTRIVLQTTPHYVAQIGDVKYRTFAEAIAAADEAVAGGGEDPVIMVLDAAAEQANGDWKFAENNTKLVRKAYIAQIVTDTGATTNKYETLAEAVADAQAGDTITMLADDNVSLTGGARLTIDKPLTITGEVDEDGEPLYTISGKPTVTGENNIYIDGSGTVALSNLKIEGFGNEKGTDDAHAPVYVASSFTGTVNLDNLYISDFNRGGVFLYGGTFNVTDCYIDCANSRSGAFTKGIEIKGTATGTIADTVIVNMERSSSTYSTAGIEVYGNGTITVNGCTILSDVDSHQSVKGTYGIVSSRVGEHDPSGGSLHVIDCYFDVSNAALSVADDDEYGPVNNYSIVVDGEDTYFSNYIATWSAGSSITINEGEFCEDVYADAGTINITGGKFSTFAPYAGATGALVISGGIFDKEVDEEYCAEDCEPADNTDAETKAAYPYTVSKYVAQNVQTSEKYFTLAAALDAAQDGQTVKLLADAAQNDGIIFNKAGAGVILDLDGKTFTVNTGANCDNRAFRIDNGTLTVKSGSIVAAGSGTTSSNGAGCYGAFRVEKGGTLNVQDATLSNSRPWGLNVKILGGRANLERVTINSSYGGGIEVTEADLGALSQPGYAELTDCTFTQTGYFDHCSTALSVSGGSELVVNSGTYTSENYGLYMFSSGGKITVKGGTITGENKAAVKAEMDTNTYPAYTGAVQISGGMFTGALSVTSPASMSISGGVFSSEIPANYCAVGYEVVPNADADTKKAYPWTVAHVNTGYIVEDEDGEGYAVIPSVDSDWIEKNVKPAGATTAEIEAALNAPDTATGLKKWEAYVLNQTAPIKADKIDGNILSTNLETPKDSDDTGLAVTYSLVSVDGASETDGTASANKSFALQKANDGSLETGLYKVRVHFKPTGDTSASEVTVDSTNTVGVLKTQPTGRFVVVPVPFKELGGNDAPVKVASYIRSGLANGDVLHVYNGSNYDSWTYNGTSWDKTTNMTVNDENTASTSESPAPSVAALARGTAAILRRAVGNTAPLVFVGDYTGEAEEQTIAAGWNLVASPSLEPFDPAAEFKSGKIQIPGDVLPKNYTFKNGKWGYSGVVEVDAPNGDGKIKMPGRIVVDTLPAGTGFWYFNDSQQPQQVEW